MNRLFSRFTPPEEPQDPVVPDIYVVVETAQYRFFVATDVASAIGHVTARRWGPRWLVFTDLFGFRHRILRSAVDRISHSAPAHRAAARAFGRARELEEKADRRPWEEDD